LRTTPLTCTTVFRDMSFFPSLSAPLQLGDLLARFPRSVPPLLHLHDRILRDRSPLTVAERELIAAFVSGLNACTYCHGSHVIAAEAFGIDPSLVAALLVDIETSGVADPLKPLLRYIEKLTRTPARLVPADADAVYTAGWSEQALFDAVMVGALFSFMNRVVNGAGITLDPLAMTAEDIASRRARMAQSGDDPYAAPRSYGALLAHWGIDTEETARRNGQGPDESPDET